MLIHHQFISTVPGLSDGRLVGSTSHPEKPHIVSIKKNGKHVCDSLNYQSRFYVLMLYSNS